MTGAEAKLVAQVLSEVDFHCQVCALRAAREMRTLFPGHDWVGLVRTAGEWDQEMDENAETHITADGMLPRPDERTTT